MDYEFKNFIFSILKLKTDNINLNLTHISINYDKAINTDSSILLLLQQNKYQK